MNPGPPRPSGRPKLAGVLKRARLAKLAALLNAGGRHDAAPTAGPLSSASPAAGPLSSASPAAGPLSSASPTAGPLSSAAPAAGPLSSASPAAGRLSSAAPAAGPLSSAAPTAGPLSSAAPAAGPLSSASPAVHASHLGPDADSTLAAGRLQLKRWPQWTLRTRMVVTVVGLAGLTLLITNIVGVTMLRSYLSERLDSEVQRLAQVVHSRSLNPGPGFGPGPGLGPGYSPGLTRGREDLGIPRGVGDPTNFVAYTPSGLVETAFPENIEPPDFGKFEDLKPLADTGIHTMTDVRTSERWRVYVITRPNDRGYAVAAISLTRVDNTVNQMTAIGLGVSALALLLLGFAGYQIVGLGLTPLTRMEEAATAIADGDLTRRVADTDPHTEAGRLGLALNTMLGRIEAEVDARIASEQRLRQFLADASHELRTPLTSIRGFAELYRRGGAQNKTELDETMLRIEDEAARMGLLVEDLLLLAALDEERPLKRSKVDLLAVAADTVRDAHVRSPHRTIELGDFEPVTVSGDEHRLRQVTSNLVANALQHTPPQAQITLRVGLHKEGAKPVAAIGIPVTRPAAVLEVSDTGPGVPLEHAQRIFERLYRADPHRARSHGGAGLGLAIVTSIVKAHGGRVELATSPGRGSTFRVILPLA